MTHEFEAQVHRLLVGFLDADVTEDVRALAHLPMRCGGLGATDVRRVADVAYAASCSAAAGGPAGMQHRMSADLDATLLARLALQPTTKRRIAKKKKKRGPPAPSACDPEGPR
jgi:hypothetical protein